MVARTRDRDIDYSLVQGSGLLAHVPVAVIEKERDRRRKKQVGGKNEKVTDAMRAT